MRYLLIGCVRCGGDLFDGLDFEGLNRSCLQCGSRPGDDSIDAQGAAGLGIATAEWRSASGISFHWARPPP